MPLYVISWADKPGGLPLRMATRKAHLEFIQANMGLIKLAGPFLDEAGDMSGSMLVIEAESLAAAQALADADPYCAAGLYERREVRQWRAAVGAAAEALK